MAKSFTKNPKVLLLNVELELKNEKENAEFGIENPEEYQLIVDAERQVIYYKLDACMQCSADVYWYCPNCPSGIWPDNTLPIGDCSAPDRSRRGI